MDERSPSRRLPYASRVWPPKNAARTNPEPAPTPAGTPGRRLPPELRTPELKTPERRALEHRAPEHRPPDPGGPGPDAAAADALPPSARWYGTPEAPPPPRVPRGLARALVVVAVLLVAGGLVAGLGYLVLDRVRAWNAPPASAVDTLAGVTYPLPPGWREGKVAPVTAFTSVATHGGDAVVMSRPGDPVRPAELRKATLELSDLYSRLLLHGDKVTVLDDRSLTVNGRAAHTRALRAEYRDVVNRPSYLRVMVIGDGGPVMVGMAQPDDPRLRADIDAMMNGLRGRAGG